jgi:hypothetical protein
MICNDDTLFHHNTVLANHINNLQILFDQQHRQSVLSVLLRNDNSDPLDHTVVEHLQKVHS